MKKIYLIFILIITVSVTEAQTWQWAKHYGKSGYQQGNSVAVDQSGNTYVTGSFSSDTLIFGSDTLFNTLPYSSQMFLVKFDVNGNVLWAKSSVGTSVSSASSVAVDTSGNAYVTGFYQCSTITFGSTTLTNSNSSRNEFFIVKFDPNGNAVWAKSAGYTDDDEGYSVATDANGNVFATGYYNNTITFGSHTLLGTVGADYFIVKYDSTGNVLWAKNANGTYDDYGNCLATDASGNVYVAGNFGSNSITFQGYTISNASLGTPEIFIVKYDPTGNVLWAKSAKGTGGVDIPYGIKTDNTGNIYLTGSFDSSPLIMGTDSIYASGASCVFIAKYNSSGTALWARGSTISGTLDESEGYGLTVDSGGSIYVVGSFIGDEITFAGHNLLTHSINSYNDIFIVQYSNNGNYLWGRSIGGNLSDEGFAITSNAGGDVYITGYFYSSSFSFGSIPVNISSGSSGDVYLAKLGSSVSINEYPAEADLSFFPNPATDKLTIVIANNDVTLSLSKGQIEISNIQGQILRTINTTEKQTSIDVSDLAGGVYIIKAKTEKGMTVKKFIKE